MYISSENNILKNDPSGTHEASKSGQFGSMNPKLYTVLIIIGVIQVLLIGYWVIPRAVSLYYQTRGGQIVDRVLSKGELTQWDSIACASPPVTNASTREILKSAEGDLKQAIRFSPNDAHPQLLIGRAYCMLGEPEKAIDAYQKYINLRPANPLGYLELGFAYEAACRAELEAIQGASRGRTEQQRCEIPEYQEPMIAAWKAAGLTTQDFIDTGEMARRNGRLNDALVWYRRGSEFSPDAGAPWFYIGQVYAALNGPRVSVASYLKAFDLGYAESINSLVDVFTENGDDEALVALLRRSLDRFPGHPERQLWWNQLGEKYMEQKDWDSAIQAYQEAIVEYPSNSQLHNNLGLSYYEGGKGIVKATEEIEKAIAIDPDNGVGYYTLARILTREKRYAEADNWFERALEKNPGTNRWQLARANAAREGGNLALAQQEYLAIIDRSPNFAPAYYEIALVYRLKEQPDEAVEAIEQAVELMATPTLEYYMRAASIYEWTEDVDKAVEAYKLALALNPQNQRASERLEKLIGVDN